MRLTLMKLSWLLASLIAGGCIAPINADVVDDHDGGEVVLPDPLDSASPSVMVTASDDAFAEIAGWLGKSNVVTVRDQMTVERDGVAVNLAAGTQVTYSFSDDLGTFTFAKPLPTVKASVLGFKVSPSLSVVTLKPDGSGVAATGLGKYKFRWIADDDAGAAAPNELPEVWCYPCGGFCTLEAKKQAEKAKKDFEEAVKDLPFKPVWKDGNSAPDWMPSQRPAFWFHVSKNQPAQDDVNNTRRKNGYSTLKQFLDTWKAERTEPKKSFSTGQAGSSARPDQHIEPRAVARVTINGSHTPPRWLVISHLLQDGIHRGRHSAATLNRLSTEQLYTLHDIDHGN